LEIYNSNRLYLNIINECRGGNYCPANSIGPHIGINCGFKFIVISFFNKLIFYLFGDRVTNSDVVYLSGSEEG